MSDVYMSLSVSRWRGRCCLLSTCRCLCLGGRGRCCLLSTCRHLCPGDVGAVVCCLHVTVCVQVTWALLSVVYMSLSVSRWRGRCCLLSTCRCLYPSDVDAVV